MKLTPLWISLVLSTPCLGQVANEDFSMANTDVWGVEHHTPGTWVNSGGNPGGMLQVNISNAQSILPAAMLVPDAAGHPWAGDFTAQDVSAFSYDREVVSGSANFGTFINLVLGNDNGTPSNFNDDTMVFVQTGDVFQFGSQPWATFSTPIPSGEITIPTGWSGGAFPGSPVAGSSDDVLWDYVIHNVDYVGLAMGRPVNGGAWFGSHILNFDNFVLDGPVNVGVQSCNPANVNSTGGSALLAGTLLTAGGTGSQSGLHLECINGVPSGLGYFLVGSVASDPGIAVSNGQLCVAGGPFYRYNVAGTDSNSVGLFNAAGILVNLVGTSSVGLPGLETGFDVPMAVAGTPQLITVGSTWHFQVWYRDTPAGSGSSNFSSALSVTF